MADSTLALDVLDADGKKAGSVELPAALFDVQTNVPLIHQVVVAQLAAARQGTHSTKSRGEVSGAGRKPFKQKGTGRARQGSIRAPQHDRRWHRPRPEAARLLAAHPQEDDRRGPARRRSRDRARGERLHVVESLRHRGRALDQGRRRAPRERRARPRTCSSCSSATTSVSVKSVRNLAYVHVLSVDQLNAYDVLVCDDIVFTKAAYDAFVAAKTGAKTEEVSA